MWPRGPDVPGKQFLPPSAASLAFPETKLVERMFQADTGEELYFPHELLSWEHFKPAEKSEGQCGVCSRTSFTAVALGLQVCPCLYAGPCTPAHRVHVCIHTHIPGQVHALLGDVSAAS